MASLPPPPCTPTSPACHTGTTGTTGGVGTPSSILRRSICTISAATLNSNGANNENATPSKKLMFASTIVPDKPAPPVPHAQQQQQEEEHVLITTPHHHHHSKSPNTPNSTTTTTPKSGSKPTCGNPECGAKFRALRKLLKLSKNEYKELYLEYVKRGNTVVAQADTLAVLADKAATTSSTAVPTPGSQCQPLSFAVSSHRLVINKQDNKPLFVEFIVDVSVGSVFHNAVPMRFNEVRYLHHELVHAATVAARESSESCLPFGKSADPTDKLVLDRMTNLSLPQYGWRTNGCFDAKFIAQRTNDIQAWLDEVLAIARRAGKNSSIRRVLTNWFEVSATFDDVMWRDNRLRPISSSPTVVARMATLESIDRLAQLE